MSEPSPASAPPAPAATEPAAPAAPLPSPAPPRGRFLVCNLVALGVAALAYLVPVAFEHTPHVQRSEANFFEDSVWDDGKAEVSRYDARRIQYGKSREFELDQVVVKEPFDPATRTKPDSPRAGVLDAIKLVRSEDVPTGRLYHHRRTLTLRVAREAPWRLLTAECGAQDWCGNSFAILVPRGDRLVKHTHSYFDGQGDKEEVFPLGTLVDEQLFLLLRCGRRMEEGVSATPLMLPSLVVNEHPAWKAVRSSIAKLPDETIKTGVGELVCEHWKVEREGLPVLEYWFGKDAPHLLARWKHGDGREGILRSTERTVYWKDP